MTNAAQNRKKQTLLLVFLLIFTAAAFYGNRPAGRPLIGVKIYEQKGDFPRLISEWKRLGINTAFISVSLAAEKEFMNLARQNQIATFIICPVFYNPEELERHPDLYAVTGKGERASRDWVQFICPSRKEYRQRRMEEIRDWLIQYQPDGISLDFIRCFVFWEMVHPDTQLDPLDSTCFCSNCLEQFGKEAKIACPAHLTSTSQKEAWMLKNHKQKWVEWKCRVIASMVQETVRLLRQAKPDVLVNVHIVPWRHGDFDDAVRTVAAQDISLIAPHVDYISPMCYWHMVKRPAAWVHSVVQEIARQTSKPIIPSIQVKEDYIPEFLSPSDFGTALHAALQPPSAGVVFWNWETLNQSREKQRFLFFKNRLP